MEWRLRSDGLCAAVCARGHGMKKRGVLLSCEGAPRIRTDFAWARVKVDVKWRLRSDGLCAAVCARGRGKKEQGVVLSCDGAPRSRTDFAWAWVKVDIIETSLGWIARSRGMKKAGRFAIL